MANVDTTQHDEFFKSKVLGHPAGLFVLFFTEMWERFSFYGMRVLLINFLTMAVIGSNPGWEWTAENAGALFGTYAGLLYLRSEEHTSELQSRPHLVCRLLLEKKN